MANAEIALRIITLMRVIIFAVQVITYKIKTSHRRVFVQSARAAAPSDALANGSSHARLLS
jgi:hypothetical protein